MQSRGSLIPLLGDSPRMECTRRPSNHSWRYTVAAISTLSIFGLLSLSGSLRNGNSLIKTWTETPTACQNPFEKKGRLHLNASDVLDTAWIPYDEECPPSRLLPQVVDKSANLHWLQNKTVLLIGNSIDRYHLDDFCKAVNGNLTIVGPNHPWSPQPYTDLEEFERPAPENGTEESDFITRPHVCHLQNYNFTMVSNFHYGLATAQEFAAEEGPGFVSSLYSMTHYCPPANVKNRIDVFAVELFKNMGRQPDIVEFGTVLWDVAHFFRIDRIENKGNENATLYQELSQDRLEEWAGRLEDTLSFVAAKFPSMQRLLWRVPHVTRNDWYIHSSRGVALGDMADLVVANIQSRSKSNWLGKHKRSLGTKMQWHSAKPADRLLSILESDDWGHLIRGQSQWMEDNVHALPHLNTLWSEMMLFQLSTLPL